MSLVYEAYNRSSLKQPPKTDFIGKWRVEYLAFSEPENAHKVPLIVLGGLTYAGGVAFYKWHRLRFHNAIWHLCVAIAAGLHFTAIALAVGQG